MLRSAQLSSSAPTGGVHVNVLSPEATAGDHEVGLGGPEDVVDGSGRQHLPHGLVDHLLIVAAAHRHRALEAHGKNLLQEGVCGNVQTSAARRLESTPLL